MKEIVNEIWNAPKEDIYGALNNMILTCVIFLFFIVAAAGISAYVKMRKSDKD